MKKPESSNKGNEKCLRPLLLFYANLLLIKFSPKMRYYRGFIIYFSRTVYET